MYLVLSLMSAVTSPICKSCGQSELGWGEKGRRQDGRPQSYFRLQANIHRDLELCHRNCLDSGPFMPNAVSRKRIRRIFGSPSTENCLVTLLHDIFSFAKGILFCLIMGFEEIAQSSGKAQCWSQRSLGLNHGSAIQQLWGTGLVASVSLSMNVE